MLFDTHCHLNIEVLSEKLESVISEARLFGVEKILIPGVTIKSSVSALEIANRHENILVGVGIHPTEIDQISNIKSQISNMQNLTNQCPAHNSEKPFYEKKTHPNYYLVFLTSQL